MFITAAGYEKCYLRIFRITTYKPMVFGMAKFYAENICSQAINPDCLSYMLPVYV